MRVPIHNRPRLRSARRCCSWIGEVARRGKVSTVRDTTWDFPRDTAGTARPAQNEKSPPHSPTTQSSRDEQGDDATEPAPSRVRGHEYRLTIQFVRAEAVQCTVAEFQ